MRVLNAVVRAIVLLVPAIAGLLIGRSLPFDLQLLDVLGAHTRGIQPSKSIVLVAYGEDDREKLKSAGAPGTPRDDIKVLKILARAKPVAVGLDFLYNNPTDYRELIPVLKDLGNVVIAVPEETSILPSLASSAKLGYAELLRDPDNKVRRFKPAFRPLGAALRYNCHLISFPLRLLMQAYALNLPEMKITNERSCAIGIRENWNRMVVGAISIGTGEEGSTFLQHLGRGEEFVQKSFFSVWSGAISPSELQGKIVIVGLRRDDDIHDTPRGSKFGMELHALALNTMLSSSYLLALPEWPMFAILVLITQVLFGISRKQGKAILLAIVLAAAAAAASTILGFWIRLTPLLIAIPLAYPLAFFPRPIAAPQLSRAVKLRFLGPVLWTPVILLLWFTSRSAILVSVSTALFLAIWQAVIYLVETRDADSVDKR